MIINKFVLILGALILPGTALAWDCPEAYDNGCDGGGTYDVCFVDGSNVICRLWRNAGTGDSDLWAVSPTGTSLGIYGTDQGGNDFCCEFSSVSSSTHLVIDGSDQIDDIRLSDPAYDLETVWVFVDGNDGADLIRGSGATTLDTCTFDGGVQNDTIIGGPGDEIIYGGIGADTLEGRGGDDTIYGGEGDDKVKGGFGADYISGGDDKDQLCGDGGIDEVYGDDDDDEVWSGDTVGDYNEGNGGTDDCTDGLSHGTCEANTLIECMW